MHCLLKFDNLAQIINLDLLDVAVVSIRDVSHRPRYLNTWTLVGGAV